MKSVALEVRNLKKSYSKQTVLNGITMRLEPGKFYSLLGQNGAGKSTLMKILARSEYPDSGEAYLFDENLFTDSASLNANLGYVAESLEYGVPLPIDRFFEFYGRFFPRWDGELFKKMCSIFQLDPDKYFHELSRGQRMQVAFAATASTKPKLFLIDEVTAVLDAHARNYVMGYLGQYVAEGGTVLMATNIVSEVQFFSNHLFLLKDGQIHLDVPRDQFHLLFLKLRKRPSTDHEVFHDAQCVEVGVNSDNSISYLIPMKDVQNYKLAEDTFDSRGITAEEILHLLHPREKGLNHVEAHTIFLPP